MHHSSTPNSRKPEVIVSLTSFPPAIPFAVKAIESILHGSVLPDRLVLYVTLSEFADGKLPAELVALTEANPVFEIRNYDRNIRSYRKLIPALIDFPEAVIVTLDDDILYHRHLLRDILLWHERYPRAVLANRAKKIKMGRPYRQWPKYRWYHFVARRIRLGYLNLPTGVGGVLYPPHCLKADMLDPDAFTRIAPTTDDIWFWAAAVANGTPVLPIPFGHNKPKGLPKPQAISLKTANFKRGTDRNLAALQAICAHYPEVEQQIARGYVG